MQANNNNNKNKKTQAKAIQGTAQVVNGVPQSLGDPTMSELVALIRSQNTIQQNMAKMLEHLEAKIDNISNNNQAQTGDLDDIVALKLKERANEKLLASTFRREHNPSDTKVEAIALRITGDEDPHLFSIAVSQVKKWFRNSRSYFSSRIRTFAPGVIHDPEARKELSDVDLKMVLILYRPKVPPNDYEVEQARSVLKDWKIELWDDAKVPAKRKAAETGADLKRNRTKRGRFTYAPSSTEKEEKSCESHSEEEEEAKEDKDEQSAGSN